MDKRLNNLDYLFHPKSIAFIGATEVRNKWGFIIYNNLLRGGWNGAMYPVNPGRETVLDIKAFPSIKDIPGDVDLAVFTIPADRILASLEECIEKGVKAGLIITAGFKELGGEFIDLELEIAKKAREGKMVIAGPNCQGICSARENFFPWMPNFYPRKGSVAVASQSGNVMSLLIGSVTTSGLGISKGVSSGNEADLRMDDYFEYFANDSDVDVILSYMEGMIDAARFAKRAKAITLEKPIVILKGGRTQHGANAASSHTGSMAVSDDLFSAMCRQCGIVVADTIDEAGVAAASFVNRPLPKGNRVAILTGGGGLGVLASDRCAEQGLVLAKLSEDTLKKIGKLLPKWWAPGNPVDLVAGLDFASIVPIMDILIKSGEMDSIMLTFLGPPNTSWDAVPKDISRGVEHPGIIKVISENFHLISEIFYNLSVENDMPIFSVMNMKDEKGISCAEKQGEKRVSIIENLELACKTVGAMTRYAEYKMKRTGANKGKMAEYNFRAP